MWSIWNTTHLSSLLRPVVRFLVLWLASLGLTWCTILLIAWSGVVLGQGGKPLLLSIQPALAGLLMAWWRWTPADEPNDVMMAMAKGMGTAILTIWLTMMVPPPLPVIPVIGGDTMGPPPERGILELLVGLMLLAILALIPGMVGGLVGALLGKHLPWNHRLRQPGPERVP